MHTFEGSNGTIIQFNPDLSGTVILFGAKNDADGKYIDAQDLKEFAIEHVLRPILENCVEKLLHEL